MNLLALKKWVDGALDSGVSGEAIVCTDSFVNEILTELSDIEIHKGKYYDDPAPKMRGRCLRESEFIYLGISGETEWGTGLIKDIPYKLHSTKITWE